MCRPRWAPLALFLLLVQPALRVQAQESKEQGAEFTPTLDEADAATLDLDSPAEEVNSDFDILKAAFDEKLADLADEHGSTHAESASDAAQEAAAKAPDDAAAAAEEAAAVDTDDRNGERDDSAEADAEAPAVNGNDSEEAAEQSEPATIDTLIAEPADEPQSPADESDVAGKEEDTDSTDEQVDLEQKVTDDKDADEAEVQQQEAKEEVVQQNEEGQEEVQQKEAADEVTSVPRKLSPEEYAQQLKDAEVKELRAVPNPKAFAQRASGPFKRAAQKYNSLLKDNYLTLSFVQATVLGTAGDALAQAIEHATGRSGTRVGAATGVHVRPWLDVRRMLDVGFLTMLIDGLLTPRWYAILEKASISRSLPVVALKTALGSFVYGPFANGKCIHINPHA
jgi:hypothetical protein